MSLLQHQPTSSSGAEKPPRSTQAIRDAFVYYFTQRGHFHEQSSPLIPKGDHTLLFTNAGMVQFKDIFLGRTQPTYTKAVTIQRCLRAGGKHNDLDNVGYTARHHTFFEMLGNFSFGSYSKKQAIEYAWTFLTDVLQLPCERLWITVFKGDKESARLWLDHIGIAPDHLSYCGEEDNFWSMGDTGPCGPCTEIFYDHENDPSKAAELEQNDEDGDKDDRRVEVWNLVFMEYNRQPDGKLVPLPQVAVDTGMGLERIAAVMQGVRTNYDIDVFKTIIRDVARVTQTTDLTSPSLRVIADHMRASCFLILDGIMPSNEGRGYVLRRIIRRAVRHGHTLGVREPLLHQLVAVVVQTMEEAYPALVDVQSFITSTLLLEEQAFIKTLEKGLSLLEKSLSTLSDKTLPGELAFLLYDTYGFPVDLTADVAREHGYTLDQTGFDNAMDKQRKQSKADEHFTDTRPAFPRLDVPVTQFVGYDHLRAQSKIVALLNEHGCSMEQLTSGQKGFVVLDSTPFYAEAGGQIGDTGVLIKQADATPLVFDIIQTSQQSGLYFHQGICQDNATLKVGDVLEAQVNADARQATACNHTATHLLHAALRQHLGDHVIQQGSLVEPNRLRFDFSYPKPLTQKQQKTIEQIVNKQIRNNVQARTQHMSLQQAKAVGAIALFDEKYTEDVRVLTIGDFSIELCGGTHVSQTGEIGSFKIINETGVAAGIRRIEAVTGEGVFQWIADRELAVEQAAAWLKAQPSQWLEKLKQTLEQMKLLEQRCEQLQSKQVKQAYQSLSESAVLIEDIHVIAAELPTPDTKLLCQTIDQLKQQFKKVIVILGAVKDGRVLLVAGVSPACTAQVTAVALLKHVALQVDGKGGGRPDMAQGGGASPDKLKPALASVDAWVRAQLTSA